SSLGYDQGRLAMILAVLEAPAGVGFAGLDVYLNVAGGLRVTQPAADLAVAAALLSARQDTALPPDAVLFGEVSLSGALRPTAQADARLREAAKLGFAAAFAPAGLRTGGPAPLELHPVADLAGFIEKCFGGIEG
ncbi:magnesium chelatase domain-containing protein, partial [Amaricoccus sp.]|uniref:magnesium chelatase domain-containing protein n=1 Tax=Amaricoccus sp. TaxID=1872485 RepID=UPI001B578E01